MSIQYYEHHWWATSDGDGLKDGDEVARGTLPNIPDSDRDGLNDSDDIAMGCDPLLADTDGDNCSDLVDPFCRDPFNGCPPAIDCEENPSDPECEDYSPPSG